MHFRTLVLLMMSILWAVACGAPSAPQSAKVGQMAVVEEGSSSGGGSFGDESALTILRWASEDLAYQISNSSPELYANLPAGWTRERLAKVIRDVRPRKDDESAKVPEVNRYGQRLMFDYSSPANADEYITATKLFMDSYSHFEVNSRPKHEFRATLEEVKLKLLHESAHLLGLGLSRETDMSEARAFAKQVMQALDSDNVECLPTSAPPPHIYGVMEGGFVGGTGYTYPESKEQLQQRITQNLKDKTRAYVFNRPSGRAAIPTNLVRRSGNQYEFNDSHDLAASGHITVFAPRTYEGSFSLKTIVETIRTGKRSYGFPEGYFSWDLIDLRKAVLTDQGYRSNYKYANEVSDNNSFSEYFDFQVRTSSADRLLLESFPPLWQEAWEWYRSGGKCTIELKFDPAGKIQSAELTLLADFRQFVDDPKPNQVNIKVPLTCVRSFKPIRMPKPAVS